MAVYNAFWVWGTTEVRIALDLFTTLGIAWLLFAVADIYEKTMENNDILRKAFPEHIPQVPEEKSPAP